MEHILIIEDDATLSGLMKDCLEKEGFQVTQVMDGACAVSEARRIDPALILLDLMLPGMDVELTRKEFELLLYFARHPGQVLTKNDLLDEVWGETEYLDENTVAVYIGRLRTKLFKEHASYIKTIWGVGYKWSVH